MIALWWMLGSAFGGELAGVTLPDTATVGGQPLVLNGLGLREKYFVDVYVGGLYLPARTTDGAKAIADDVPKRLVMHFVYSSVPAAKMVETFEEGFAQLPDRAPLADRIAKLEGWMVDLTTGDRVEFDYVPGVGTTVRVKGREAGVIEGADFMRGLFSIYVGPNPPTAALKKGLLGG